MAPRQLDMNSPAMNVRARVKAAMREAIRRCDLSRQEIVDEMNRIAQVEGMGGARGSKITLANLDAWVAETKPNLIPVDLMTLFCVSVKSSKPIEVMAAPCVDFQKKMKLVAYAEAEIASKEAARKKRRILSEIGDLSDG